MAGVQAVSVRAPLLVLCLCGHAAECVGGSAYWWLWGRALLEVWCGRTGQGSVSRWWQMEWASGERWVGVEREAQSHGRRLWVCQPEECAELWLFMVM